MLFLRNASLIDGTGAPAREGHLLIDGDRIAAAGSIPQPAEAQVVDCQGLVAAPGFIDIHSHSDLQVLQNDRAKAEQGVTTEVVGNCGFSPYPCAHDPAGLHEFADGILYGHGAEWGWPTARDYLHAVDQQANLANVYSLVGHGSLRVAVMGSRQGAPTSTELDTLASILAECLQGGAAGFSTGLMYAPGSSAPREELVRLCRVTAQHGKVHATHMRNYAQDILASIDEQLDLARESGVRLQISHLQCVGRANWDKQQQALERIEQARASGLDVEFDSYPYLAGSTVLTQLLPQSAMDGGHEALVQRLTDPAQRPEIARETVASMPQQWADIFIASVGSQHNQHLVGRTIAAIAAEKGATGIDTAIDLLIEERGIVNILSFNQSEANLQRLLTHPLCTVISDGFYVKGRPHPRLYGTFPNLLGEVVRRRRWLTLPEAVHKVTGKPAARFGMKDRGRLAPGAIADVTVFHPQQVDAKATYEAPVQSPEGITLVLRAGKQITPPRVSKN